MQVRRQGADSRRVGFTLIELLIAVAIIGLLAAIGIPGFLRFHLRAKSAEARANLAAIRSAEEVFFTETGTYASCLPAVPAAVGTVKVAWPLDGSGSHGFELIGFEPEGRVHYRYGVVTNGGGKDDPAYTAEGQADIDGDGAVSSFGYVKPAGISGVGVAGPLGNCAASGVYNPATGAADALEVVGPCDSLSGVAVF